jgi:hypothetical protein
MTHPRIEWLIPTFRIRENWQQTQAKDERERQLTRAEAQRQRRAARNLKRLRDK